MNEHDLREMKLQLQLLKNWPIGMNDTFYDVGRKLIELADLNIRIVEALLNAESERS